MSKAHVYKREQCLQARKYYNREIKLLFEVIKMSKAHVYKRGQYL
jgi:hypothetical protein